MTALLNAMDEARGGLIDSLLELLELHSDDGELITLGQAALLLISYGFWEEDTILKCACSASLATLVSLTRQPQSHSIFSTGIATDG